MQSTKKQNISQDQSIPKATHQGKLNIGDFEIICFVLEDGRSVISEKSMNTLLGIRDGGRKKIEGRAIPRFLSNNNLQVFIPQDLLDSPESIIFKTKNSNKSYGFECERLPEILTVYLDARRAGVLTDSQQAIAITAEIILTALAKTGIVALIHEVTGFQAEREKNELQKLFSKFIAQELQPWVRMFPPEFFHHLKRMYGLEHMQKTPQFFGHLINRLVYKELSSEILEELKRVNPRQDNGHRKGAHHQWLTHDTGHPALNKQIQKVITLMSISDDIEQVYKYMEKTKS